MRFIAKLNGYDICEYSESECKEYGYCWPTFGAFLTQDPERTPLDEECSMNCVSDLIDWCENN